jgi:hypothetical protein
VPLEEVVVVGVEDVAGVALGRALGAARPDLLHERLQVETAVHGRTSRFDRPGRLGPERRSDNFNI